MCAFGTFCKFHWKCRVFPVFNVKTKCVYLREGKMKGLTSVLKMSYKNTMWKPLFHCSSVVPLWLCSFLVFFNRMLLIDWQALPGEAHRYRRVHTSQLMQRKVCAKVFYSQWEIHNRNPTQFGIFVRCWRYGVKFCVSCKAM